MSKWIKKDDRVLVLAGNDRGRVSTVVSRKDDRVVVQGVNIRKKHVKRKTQTGAGSIIDMEMPIHISNVALCNEKGERLKVSLRVTKEGQKGLYYKDGDKEVLHREIRKLSNKG